MSIELAELALVEETFTPTEDRLRDLVLTAFAGTPVSGYNNEFAGVLRREHAWCHAKLAGTEYPALYVHNALGERVFGAVLTHRIFYATDFGRSPIEHAEAVQCIQEDLLLTWPDDIRMEYGVCLKALGQSVPEDIISLAEQLQFENNHNGIVARLLLKRIS